MPSKTQPDKMLPVTFGTHKPIVWHPRCEPGSETIGASPLEAGSRQQQDSSPCQSKITRRSDIISANGLAWENACRFGASPLETGSETPEQQQDSSPCQAKRSPTKCFPSPLEPTKKQFFCLAPSVRGWFRNHWRKSLGGRFRNTRTATGFEPMPSKTQPDKMLPVTFGTHKKQFFCLAPSVRGWFRNHWRKSLGSRFRNTRTAAGFGLVPKPLAQVPEAGSETLEQQQDSSPCQAKRSPTKCFPSPLEPIKNSSFVWHPRCEAGSETIGASPLEAGSETLEQQQDSSPCQAKRSPTKCFPSPLEPIKNSSFVWHPRCEAGSETIGASPLEAGSETLEQQQDSSPCQAKRSPTKCFPSPLEPIKNSSFVWHPRCEAGSETIGASPLEAGSETLEQQQDSSPCQAKRNPTKCFPSPLEPIKNSSFVWHPRCEAGSETIGASPLEAGSETLEQQQDSSPCQAKRSPTKCFPPPLEPIKNSSFVWHPRCEAGSETIAWMTARFAM